MTQKEPITAPEERCRLLALKISRILQNGLALNADTLHFMDSTFSTSSPEALADILKKETHSEVETLLSLFFFPDTALQMQLENFLETLRFEPRDEALVLTYLDAQLPDIPVGFPGRPEALRIRMPLWAGERFISRLNISKRLNPDLLAAVERHVEKDRSARVKVTLRNSRFTETENRISFLCAFFDKLPDADMACLDFLLSLFEEQNDHPDICEALTNRKRHCFQSLQKAAKFQKMLRTENMETLMLRGVRMPHVDTEDMKAKMKLIDRICLAICGKTEYFHPPEAVLGVGDYHLE